jgi:hypothetical protein
MQADNFKKVPEVLCVESFQVKDRMNVDVGVPDIFFRLWNKNLKAATEYYLLVEKDNQHISNLSGRSESTAIYAGLHSVPAILPPSFPFLNTNKAGLLRNKELLNRSTLMWRSFAFLCCALLLGGGALAETTSRDADNIKSIPVACLHPECYCA